MCPEWDGARQNAAALPGLAGLEAVRDQLADWLTVVRAERARILAGAEVRRRAWKNAVFTGPPGSGKSRAAAALARAYKELGVLPFARVYETAAAGLAGSSARETADLVHDAAQRAAAASCWSPVRTPGAACPMAALRCCGRCTRN